MTRLRILVLAPGANPDSLWGPLIAYSQAQALALHHDVTLVILGSREEALRRKPGAFHYVEVVKLPCLERIHAWITRHIFNYNYYSHYLQLFNFPLTIAFEWQAWRQMRARIMAGGFDVVLRLLPISSIMPSPFAFYLRNGPIPFVIGPVNGGLPWPAGFKQASHQRVWISDLRFLREFLPFARSTYRRAAAIIGASSHTCAELARYRGKLFFLPENGLDQSFCSGTVRGRERSDKLELIFVGGLIPLKGCDLALRGAASLLRADLAHFTVVGDGPERSRLEQLAGSSGIDSAVSFCGFLSHPDAMERLRAADVMVFPSLREFGGAVVFEALALGVVPVVADFGGPGDIVHQGVGCKVALTTESDVIGKIEEILHSFARDPDRLDALRKRGVSYVRECFTWDAKAQALTSIIRWTLGQGPKPNLPPPKMLRLEGATLGVEEEQQGKNCAAFNDGPERHRVP